MIGAASSNTLFNRRAVKKLSENVALSRTAKKAKDKWLDMLESGELKKEQPNYTNFQKIILEEVLGYSLTDDVKFSQNNIEFQVVDSEGKAVVCIEAKGQGVDLWKPTPQNKNGAVGQLWWYMSDIMPKYGIVTDYDRFILFQYDVGRCQHYEFRFSSIRDNEYLLKEFVRMFSKEHMIERNSLGDITIAGGEIEKDLEEEFYDIFHKTRTMLVKEFEEHTDNRSAIDQAQTFLNRLIFVMFAESRNYVDRHLLYEQVRKSVEGKQMGDSTTVVFNAIDKVFRWFAEGRTKPDVFAFNGGLFTKSWPRKASFPDVRPKEHFPNIQAREPRYAGEQADILGGKDVSPIVNNILLMLRYDFESDLTVNILGHIFEQSLDDLDRLMDEGASERKEMGVYYTPPYVTDYVCRQTIIPYLAKTPDTTSTRELVEQYSKSGELDVLAEKLKSIRILDPACGSGAFLVKAVDVLLEVHNELLDQKSDAGAYEVVMGGKKGAPAKNETFGMMLAASIVRQIVEECIFGIDISEQSVEISRIALFFKLAGDRRKLPDLSKNIRQGNTILTRGAGGERPFDWAGERGFPQVCANKADVVGVLPGFGVIVGNPPYVRQERLAHKDCMQLPKNHTLKGGSLPIHKRADKSSYFYYHSLNWLKAGGRLGFIASDSWLSRSYGRPLRKMLACNCSINVMLKPDYKVFHNIDVKNVITILTKGRSRDNVVRYASVRKGDLLSSLEYEKKDQDEFGERQWTTHFVDPIPEPKVKMTTLDNVGKLSSGASTKFNSYFVLDDETAGEYGIHPKFLRPILPKSMTNGKARDADRGRYVLSVTAPMPELLRDSDARGLLRYIREGETRTFPAESGTVPSESPTLRKRPFWFYLKAPRTPDAFLGATSDDRHKVVENGGGPGNALFGALDTWVCFEARDRGHLHALLACARSSLFSLHMEVVGHPMGGGALDMKVEDYAAMPVPDTAALDAAGLKRLAGAWKSYCRTLDQGKLDGVVFGVLGLAAERDAVVERLLDAVARRKCK